MSYVKEAGLKNLLTKVIGLARNNAKDLGAAALIPGGTVLVPANKALSKAADYVGPPVAKAMRKSPEFKKAVTMGLLKMGQMASMRDEISEIVGMQKTAEWPGPIKFLPKGPERDRQLARLKREHTTRSKSTSAQKDLMDDLKFHAEEVYDKSVVGKGGIPNSRYFSALDQIGQGKLKTKADVTSYLNKTAAPSQQDINYTASMETQASQKTPDPLGYAAGIEDGRSRASYPVTQSTSKGRYIKPPKGKTPTIIDFKPYNSDRKLPISEPHQHGAAYGLVAKAPTKIKKAWAALAKTAFAPPISTKPLDTSVSTSAAKSGKIAPPGAGSAPSKNAGAPKGARVVVNKKGMVWDKNAPVTTRA